jgi:hypothetical protein
MEVALLPVTLATSGWDEVQVKGIPVTEAPAESLAVAVIEVEVPELPTTDKTMEFTGQVRYG